jgi:hypothetical protein
MRKEIYKIVLFKRLKRYIHMYRVDLIRYQEITEEKRNTNAYAQPVATFSPRRVPPP